VSASALALPRRNTPARRRAQRRRRLLILGLMSPWLIGFCIFFGYPLVYSVYLSFTHYDLLSSPRWIGTANYDFMLHGDPNVGPAVRNTLWIIAVMVPLQVLLACSIAMLVARARAGVGVFRTIFYLPALTPPVAATLGFLFLLNPSTGPVNTILGHIGLSAPSWFNDPTWSKPALTLLAVWGVGDLMVIFMAALLDVPRELYEASELDGAGAINRFRHVTLPHLRPVLLFALITGVIAAMQYYTEPIVAGQVASGQIAGSGNQFEPGYPGGSTLTLPQLVYNLGFQRFNIGAACVIAMVLFVLSMIFAALLMRRGSGFLGAED